MGLALHVARETDSEALARYGERSLAMDFSDVYAQNFDFVWRNVQRLGVPPSAADDAVQDVFIVAHRRLAEFEGRSSIRTWLFAILRRVARDHRPTGREQAIDPGDLAELGGSLTDGPFEAVADAEAARLLRGLLQQIDEHKREAFILVDLEQMSVPEAADALGANLNTMYSRVRAARDELASALGRRRAETKRREPWND
jgi:RNA polymerase sigma-70 factor, ECF subfamily